MKLSILIATVEERKDQFTTLYNKLTEMIKNYSDIEIVVNDAPRWDEPNGLTVGEKRQALIEAAKGKYILFVDDDDDVMYGFIRSIYSYTFRNVDVINGKTLAYINGKKYIIDNSIHYENEQLHDNGEIKRYPSVMSVWNRELCNKAKFKALNVGEDFDWTKSLNPQTEIKIDDIINIYNYSDEHTIASKTPKRCIVTFSNTPRYDKMAERLKQSCFGMGYDFLHFKTFEEINCRPHADHPYSFKPYAIHKAHDMGYNSILWIDSAIFLTQDPIKVFKYIEKNGVMLFDNIGHDMGTYTNDNCLDYFGITREDSFNIKMVMACSMGFYFHNKNATNIFNIWKEAAFSKAFIGNHEQTNGKVNGHRHDQSAISCIAHQNNINLLHPHSTFIAYYGNPGMLPHGEDVCMISKGL